jgi:hypothetical protein
MAHLGLTPNPEASVSQSRNSMGYLCMSPFLFGTLIYRVMLDTYIPEAAPVRLDSHAPEPDTLLSPSFTTPRPAPNHFTPLFVPDIVLRDEGHPLPESTSHKGRNR